jgi:hypothetical protein
MKVKYAMWDTVGAEYAEKETDIPGLDPIDITPKHLLMLLNEIQSESISMEALNWTEPDADRQGPIGIKMVAPGTWVLGGVWGGRGHTGYIAIGNTELAFGVWMKIWEENGREW